MISSLFIRPPWDSDGIIFSGHDAPPGRVVPVDSAKTGLASAHPEAGGHVENRALLIPRLKSDLETGANVASLFAIYSNRKSTVSRVRGFFLRSSIFFHGGETPTRFVRGTGCATIGEKLPGRQPRCDSLRGAAI